MNKFTKDHGRILIFINIFLLLIFYPQTFMASSNFEVISIDCHGKFFKISNGDSKIIYDANLYGTVIEGYLNKNFFFDLDIYNKFIKTDLLSNSSKYDNNLNSLVKGYINTKRIFYVDNEYIYIIGAEKSSSEKKGVCSVYQLSKENPTIKKLPAQTGCLNSASVFNNTIYFTNLDGDIYLTDKNTKEKIGIKGDHPIISPDGSKLAYIAKGLLKEQINVFDLKTEKTIKAATFFGGEFVEIIRWSGDSNYLAVRKKLDLISSSILIIEAQTGKILQKINKPNACNWFLR